MTNCILKNTKYVLFFYLFIYFFLTIVAQAALELKILLPQSPECWIADVYHHIWPEYVLENTINYIENEALFRMSESPSPGRLTFSFSLLSLPSLSFPGCPNL
jgi:hypothetical protein